MSRRVNVRGGYVLDVSIQRFTDETVDKHHSDSLEKKVVGSQHLYYEENFQRRNDKKLGNLNFSYLGV